MVDEHGFDEESKGLCDEKTKHGVDQTRFWKSHANTEQFRLWVLGKKERRRESALFQEKSHLIENWLFVHGVEQCSVPIFPFPSIGINLEAFPGGVGNGNQSCAFALLS